jgi:molybdopterin-guanine dinucleotide biosynthesis protein A
MKDTKNIIGVLLAGGLARRMGGGDKCLQMLGGKTLLSYAIDLAKPQVSRLILNATGDGSRFSEFDLPVVPDVVDGAQGPLAGILTGMEWAAHNVNNCEWIVTFPTDAPFFPSNLVERMLEKVHNKNADMACARSNERTHPVFALWPIKLAGELRQAMLEENLRKIDKWTTHYNIVNVDWTTDSHDPFFNINFPEDLLQAEEYLN